MTWITLLKNNASLRYLWLSQFVSSIGDWFNYVAIIYLVLHLTDSGLQVAITILCRTIPLLVLGPWAGVLIDRLNKKWIMLGSDLGRAVLVLGYLYIDRVEDLWIIYLLGAVLSIGSVLFDAAKLSYMPQILEKENLYIANALTSFTFGLTIALGSMLSGWTIGEFGYYVSFIFNSASFLISALLLQGIESIQTLCEKKYTSWSSEFLASCKCIKDNPLILALLLADSCLAVGSGLMNVLIGIFAVKVFLGESIGIGIFYNALGLGFIVGSIFTSKVKPKRLKTSFLINSFMLVGIGASIIFFSQSPTIWLAAFWLVVLYFCQGTCGVHYTSLLMFLIPKGVQGRIFVIDRTKLLIIMSSTNLLAGFLLEGFSARLIGLMTGLFVLMAGIYWTIRFVYLFKAKHNNVKDEAISF